MFSTSNDDLAQPGYMRFLVPCVLLLAFALRCYEAGYFYLNPDEAIHFCRAQLPNWYQESNLRGTAPPFFFFVVHYTQQIASSEFFLRLPFILCGCLFPWVILKWLERLNLPVVALTSFLILEFSPNLITLTSQIRGYAIALLLTSLSLYFLERALERSSVPFLLSSAGFLYLAILTEFSAAFATAALGLYALLRILSKANRVFTTFHMAWVATQFGALAVYFFLYKTMMVGLLARPFVNNSIEGYLHGGFLKPGENLFSFFAAGSLKQFAYLASSIPMGVVFLVLFMAGSYSLWKVQPEWNRSHRRAISLAVCLAFSTAFFASLARVFPYGRTRHSILLALFATPVIAIGLDRLLHRVPRLALPAALLITAILFPLAEHDGQNISPSKHKLSDMIQAIKQLRTAVPPGALILADSESTWMMNYYLTNRQCSPIQYLKDSPRTTEIAPYRFFSLGWSHRSETQIQSDLVDLRKIQQFPETQPIYALDGGFDLLSPSIPGSRSLSGVLLLIPPSN